MIKNSLFLLLVLLFYFFVSWAIYSEQNESKEFFLATSKVMKAGVDKSHLVEKMHTAVRERANILLKMSLEKDVFILDEYVTELTLMAGNFRQARESLLLLVLNQKEKTLLEKQSNLAVENSPLQDHIAELFLEERSDEANELLFSEGIPGQNKVIHELLEMSKIYRELTENQLNVMSIEHEYKIERANFTLGIIALFALVLISLFIYVTKRSTAKITEKAALEKESAQFQLEQQQAAINKHAIVSITDVKGTITFANDKFSKVSGYSHDELIGQNHRLVNSHDQSKDFWKDMYRTVASGKTWKKVVRNKSKHGEYYWVDTTIVPFMEAGSSKPVNYVSIRNEVTELVEREKLLVEARIAAESSVKAKSDFLSTMSHEIRTPMNAIIGMSHLALETKLDKAQRNYISKAHNAAESLLGIINDILDFSKIESGKMSIEEAPYNEHDVFNNLKNIIHFKTDEKGLDLIFDLDDSISEYLIGDPLRLGQIFINLVNNAVKFTDKGSITIASKLLEQKGEQLKVQYTVSDTGIGINKEQQSKLFEAFSQADTSTSRKYGGTGLGLTITKNFIELMGGKIWIESVEGEGSHFIFTVNLLIDRQETVKRGQQQTGDEESKDKAITQLRGAKLLLVEDNRINQEVASKILSSGGVEVVIAENGQEGVEALEKQDFDGVLMDLQMPVMNGFEAATIIREQEKYNELPVIALSASVMQDELQKIDDVGMNDYVTKPIDVTDLFTTLAQWVVPKNPLDDLDEGHHLNSLMEQPENNKFIDEPVNEDDKFKVFKTIDKSIIDVDNGLKNTVNNKDLYINIVLQFIEAYSILDNEIDKAISSTDEDALRRLIHTLKSAAGTIGAMTLFDYSADFEEKLLKNTVEGSEQEAYIAKTLSLNTDVLKVLLQFQADIEDAKNKAIDTENLEQPSVTEDSLDISDVQIELLEIQHKIENFDIEAAVIVEDVIADLSGKPEIKDLKQILFLIKDYEFEQANDLLKDLITLE